MANSIGGTAASNYSAQTAGLEQFKTSQSESAAQEATKDVNKDMFLKLMVAQLKNQNPLNPMDGTDFLQQLSQISGVEQMVEMRKELESIHQLLGAGSAASEQA